MTVMKSLEAYGNVKQQCLLVGKTKSMYDAGYAVQDIAKQLKISVEFTEELIKMIKDADQLKKAEK